MRCVFFFQAEDGIRDLVRSRWLGDVDKRQTTGHPAGVIEPNLAGCRLTRAVQEAVGTRVQPVPVSYPHLPLPTSDLV